MALALYRKYRPKLLSELLGQEVVSEIIKNAAKSGKIGHAYLFYGPRGTGKTTTARLIAKLLNCERRRGDEKFRNKGEPCNDCRHCRDIDNQTSFDVIEIDAASNRGIDEIRDLKNSIRVSPSSADYKVYIIDEAHMLTGAASNALLKTLEEPPAHAVIVLATTEYEKLPATITSRTQRFVFKKLPKIKIMEKLKTIAEAEKIEIDEPALELIAAAAEGSFRDAESLLDQISSFAHSSPSTNSLLHQDSGGQAGNNNLSPERSRGQIKNIDLQTVERVTGRAGLKKIHELTDLILEKDLKSATQYIADLNEEGHNLVQVTKDLIHYLRKVLSLKLNPSLEKSFGGELTADEIEKVKQLGNAAEEEFTVKLIKSLITAYSEMRYSPFSIVPLEIALIENLS